MIIAVHVWLLVEILRILNESRIILLADWCSSNSMTFVTNDHNDGDDDDDN